MNKIINGRKYDTETAHCVCRGYLGDFGTKWITLYQKLNGEFFEFHQFGDREWIEPVSQSEAKKFAEEQMTGKEYEAFFGKVEE